MQMQLSLLLLLSLGHLMVDLAQGALPFFLPFFKEAFGLSYTAVGAIMMGANLSSSVIQPVIGLWSDRGSRSWLLPLGCLVAGLGIGLTGLSPNYFTLMLLTVFCGLGVAAYHPEASKTARWASGPQRATSMAVFSVGGNFGFGLGPLFGGLLFAWAGLRGTPGLILPAAAIALILWAVQPRIRALAAVHQARPVPPPSGPQLDPVPAAGAAAPPYGYLPVVLLLLAVCFRSWVHAGLSTYIPLYYVSYLGGDPMHARDLQTAFLLSGAAGTLVGSPLADRWGLKNLMILSMIAQIPLIWLFPQTHGLWLYLVLAATGFLGISTFAATVVLGQELLPNRLGLASGLMLGFAVGTGGLGVTLLGMVADSFGVPAALRVLALLPAAALFLILFVPEPKAEAARAH